MRRKQLLRRTSLRIEGRCAWFDKLTMRVVSDCNTNHQRCKIPGLSL